MTAISRRYPGSTVRPIHVLLRCIVGLLLLLFTAFLIFAVIHQPPSQRQLARSYLSQTNVGRYSTAGPYVLATKSGIDPPEVIIARNGLPVRRYAGRYEVNPMMIAQYGLWAYTNFLHHRRSQDRRLVLRAARWLLANQHNGSWLYRFPYAANGWTLEEPWASALAQGTGMSLLARAYRLTSDRRYVAAAIAALAPLRRSVLDGGLQRCFRGDCQLRFFEEYPTQPPSYTLNGFMFTLIGLHDLATVAPDSGAAHDFEAGMRTLLVALPRFDIDGAASYDLTQETIPGEKSDMHLLYQAIDVTLLRVLNSIAPAPQLRFYAMRWLTDIEPGARKRIFGHPAAS